MRAATLGLHWFLAAWLLGCQATPPSHDRTPGQTGASLALLPDGKRLVVVDPDQGSVSILDAQTLTLLATVAVGGEPHQLLVADGLIVVATYRGGELVAVDPESLQVVRRIPVCAGPWGLARAPAGWLAVGCEWQGQVRKVSVDFKEVTTLGAVWRARAVAVQGETVRAATFAGPDARIWSLGPLGVTSVRPLPDGLADGRDDLPKMTPSQVTALLPLPDGSLIAALQLVDNLQPDGGGEPLGYGAAVDGRPRINPAVVHLDAADRPMGPGTYARFDNSGRAVNGPSALAWGPGDQVWVTHLSSNDVSLLDLRAGAPETRWLRKWGTAAGPRGVVVDAAQGVAWVDGAFDNAVTRITIDGSSPPLTRVRALPQPFSASARQGRKAFHDATNPHLTPLGVVACSTCHPDGGDDGLLWHLHAGNVTPRLRRSQHLGVAPVGVAGLHWDAEFPSLFDLLQSTVPNLLGGDALLLNAGDFAAYLHEMVHPPLPPPGDAQAIARGQALFEAPPLDCTRCHSGPAYTDLAQHTALSPMTTTAGDTLAASRTPSLRGLFLRAPFFHDGRAADLMALHNRTDLANHGDPSGLTNAQMADLVAFLSSL